MARPRSHHEPRVATAVRLPRRLHSRLRQAAGERDVSVNLLITRAVEEYLERLAPLEELLGARGARPGGGPEGSER